MRGVNKEELASLYRAGMSIPDLSRTTGMPKSNIRYRLKKMGALRTRTEAVRLAAMQGKIGPEHRGKPRTFTSEHCKKISEAKLGKGKGLSKKPNGYLEITLGENKGRGLHRVVVEKTLGRKLDAGEVVHHINGVRDDNRPENLEVMTRGEHARLHAIENYSTRVRDAGGRFV